MKTLLSVIIVLALVSSVAWASIPDPDYCVVLPGDLMANPRIVGIPAVVGGAPYWNLSIHVAAWGGSPIANSYVEIIFDVSCEGLCSCTGLVLTGYTNASGDISLQVRLGGCCEATVAALILADNVPIRQYELVVSPDVTGPLGIGDCATFLDDFGAFGAIFGGGTAGCADYNGDDLIDLSDFTVFASAWGRSCPHD